MKDTGKPYSLALLQARERKNRLDYLLEKLELTLQELKREFPDVKVTVDNSHTTKE
jgi:hypothetical protein